MLSVLSIFREKIFHRETTSGAVVRRTEPAIMATDELRKRNDVRRKLRRLYHAPRIQRASNAVAFVRN